MCQSIRSENRRGTGTHLNTKQPEADRNLRFTRETQTPFAFQDTTPNKPNQSTNGRLVDGQLLPMSTDNQDGKRKT